MGYYWNAESWGSEYPPENWEEIADTANGMIDEYIGSHPAADDAEIEDFSGMLWEKYCANGSL